MRFPSIPTLIRTFSLYSFNATGVRSVYKGAQGVRSATLGKTTLWSMPTVPFLGAFFGQKRDMTEYPGKQSEEYWQAKLTPDQFRVIRQKGTEQPYDNEYDRHMPTEGVYVCISIIDPIYSSLATFVVHTWKLTPTLARYSNAQHVINHYIAPTTSSSPAAAGPPTSMPFQALSSVTTISVSECQGRRLCAQIVEDIWDMCSKEKDTRHRRMRGIASTRSACCSQIRSQSQRKHRMVSRMEAR